MRGSGAPHRRHHDHRPGADGGETRPGLDLSRLQARHRRDHAGVLQRTTSPRTASTGAMTSRCKTGPYNFGFPDTKPNWVEHFPYQDGLLVWYSTLVPRQQRRRLLPGGRCGGFFLPVDAHPDLLIRPETARSGGRASSRTTRPSGWSRRIGSALTSTASARRTAGSPPTPSSTTRRATGRRRTPSRGTSAGPACGCRTPGRRDPRPRPAGSVDDRRRQVQVAIAMVASPPGCNENARRVTGGRS